MTASGPITMTERETNEALLKAVEEDAMAESGRIIREAEDASLSVIRAALEEAAAMKEERLKVLEDSLKRKRASVTEGARIRAGGELLRARHEAINAAIEEAGRRIRRLPPEEYSRLILSFHEEARRVWDSEIGSPPLLRVNPEDARIFKERGVEAVPDERVSLGVLLVSTDGRIRFENTLSSRTEKARKRISSGINSILFG